MSVSGFSRKPLGCCTNCFHRLPRVPSRSSGVIQQVEFINPESGVKVTLKLLDALQYIFKDRCLTSHSSSAANQMDEEEEDWTFCMSCGPDFKLLLKTFNSFIGKSKVESSVYKLLVDRPLYTDVEVKIKVEEPDFEDNTENESPEFQAKTSVRNEDKNGAAPRTRISRKRRSNRIICTAILIKPEADEECDSTGDIGNDRNSDHDKDSSDSDSIPIKKRKKSEKPSIIHQKRAKYKPRPKRIRTTRKLFDV